MQGSSCRLGVASLGWPIALVIAGCTVVAPLDSVVTSASGIDEVDGGSVKGKGGATKPPPSIDDEDAGIPTPDCTPPRGGECDPIAQCGCDMGTRCEYATGGAARCYVMPSSGKPQEGERCNAPDACAEGLECPATGLCTRRCTTDRDCAGSGICVQVYDVLPPHAPITGYRVCVTPCDPVSGVGCALGTTCEPTENVERLESAVCYAIQPEALRPQPSEVDEACQAHVDCNVGLGCIQVTMDGRGVCTPWCRRNTDCPVQRSVCQLLDWYYASSTDPVGQCVAVQVGTTTDVCGIPPDPLPWTQGPVWTLDDVTDCLTLCGAQLEDACVIAMCPRGDEFVDCLATTIGSCSGASTGLCRPEYTEASCCQEQNCLGAVDLAACNQQFCADSIGRWSMCAGNDEVCAELATNTCVE